MHTPIQHIKKLAQPEQEGKLKAVITQNIDGLHQAAGLIDSFAGDKLVVINRSPTPRDTFADLVIQGSIGEVFASLS